MNAGTAKPNVIVVAGPNGAGKSTAAPRLLRDALAVREFVNADTIASGLSAFRPESVAIAAGRVMLARMRALAAAREDFASETTLASRSFAPWLTDLQLSGYDVHLLFLWLCTPELAVSRVAERVRLGGHDVPARVIRRRYRAGLINSSSFTCPWRTAGIFLTIRNRAARSRLLRANGQRSVLCKTGTWRLLNETYNGR